MDPSDIQEGIAVFHRANPGRIGILTGQVMEAIGVMGEVDWGSQTEFVDVSQLEPRARHSRPTMDSEVQAGRYGTIEDLRRRITFEKLRGMLTDVFYSMKTSEIDFYPHQFKPVLRFIESATNRLLIADEVGLGKTIEAGLIWTEWQAREKARRLLVVCPPTLVPKWLRELQDRFQFAAEASNARHLLDLFDRFTRRGPSVSFVLVTSYHALRPFQKERAQLQRLREEADSNVASNTRLSPRVKLLQSVWEQADTAGQSGGARFLDMVVFDEAHSMKNTASASYLAGELLSEASAAAVCLSATPIHNESRDLYALLRLIDPEVFRDEYVFDLLRQQNLPIVRLQNALSATGWQGPDIEPLIAALDSDEAQASLRTALHDFDGSPRARVELRHMAERLNLLGNFINRTRKRDVIGNRVIRQPVTRTVKMTRSEAVFYRAVLELVRREVAQQGKTVTSFHLIHPALRMSSCLAVIADAVRRGKWGGFEELEQVAEDFEDAFDFDTEDESILPHELRALAEHDFEADDSKYAALVEALRYIAKNGTLRSDKGEEIKIAPNEKIIVFAFFKGTIAYLHRRLTADGFACISVTGDIKDKAARDKAFQEFEADTHRILLCSEIGAEGVDLQFARIVVNYDLPWNPMRVEQRIGRIDRIGQKSASIVVVNFHVLDTIDGSIYAHLYSKIGIFEHSIGALEGILGERVNALTSQIFREDLTMEQIAERAAQTGEAICNQAKLTEKLEESTASLIAFQDLLSERIGESQRLGRFIKPDELRLHAEDFLASRYTEKHACLIIADNPAPDCLECTLSYKAASDFEEYCHRNELAWPDGFSRGSKPLHLTFDPSVHQRLKREFRRLVLVTHLHPFFQWITHENSTVNNHWHKVSAVRLETDQVAPGRYVYLVHRSTMEGITRRDGFHYAVKSLATGAIHVGNDAELLLNAALDRGESLFPRSTPDYSADLRDVRASLVTELKSVQEMFRADQKQKFDIRKQQLRAHFQRRIDAQKRRIATAESSGRLAKGAAGFRVTLANLMTQLETQSSKLKERAASLTESTAEVACGFIEVEPLPKGAHHIH